MVARRRMIQTAIAFLLLFSMGAPLSMALGGAEPPSEPPEDSGESAAPYRVTLGPQLIEEGTELLYITVSPEFAETASPPYYPGELTVEITGPIVIESGGSLTIGTYSIGSNTEASPVIQGVLGTEPLIWVKPGGSLRLTDTVFKLDGKGLFIVQEPGASVELQEVSLGDGLAEWAPPVVDNSGKSPKDIWLEEGTPFTEAMLPEGLQTYVQSEGTSRYITVPIRWDFSGYDGRTSGTLTLVGSFLDEKGDALSSLCPLTITANWYKPDQLIVTDAVFMGGTPASAKLQLKELPKEATEVWGEVSSDGVNWVRWEQNGDRTNDDPPVFVFYLPNNTPRYYRLRAADPSENMYWVSDSFLLPMEDTEDQGGNRGGSISPAVPDRDTESVEDSGGFVWLEAPTPEPLPAPIPEAIMEPASERTEPTPAPSPAPPERIGGESSVPASAAGESVAPAADTPSDAAEPTIAATAKPTAALTPLPSAQDMRMVSGAEPAARGGLTPFSQVILGTAGAGACAGIGVGAARYFRRRH